MKVLDFGLAKALDVGAGLAPPSGAPQAAPRQDSPTLTAAVTREGLILGTAAYMSPEQACGRLVDRRADIWAFGCVLYEMLTGAHAFGRETLTETMVAVMKEEPDWRALPEATPAAIQKLVCRCLNKDVKHRLQAIGDARITIEETLTGSPDVAAVREPPLQPAPQAAWRRALPWAVAAVLGIALISLLVDFWRLRQSVPTHQVLRLVINDTSSLVSQPALSPDGRMIADVLESDSGGGDAGKLYVRALDQFTGAPLRNTQGAANPFFSPDGSWIGYSSPQGLMKVPAKGGTPELICPAASEAEAVWGPGNTIVFWGAENNGSLCPA